MAAGGCLCLPGPPTDPNSTRVPVQSQVLVRASLVQDNIQYLMGDRPGHRPGKPDHPQRPGDRFRREAMWTRLRDATTGLDQVFDSGFGQAGFYTMVPRNSTAVLVFNDLLDPETINSETIETIVGPQPFGPYDARVIPDPLYGDLQDYDGDGQAEFYTTRVLVDFTGEQL